jgi:hypothetical protein
MTSNAVIVATNENPPENGVASIMEPPMIENVIRHFPLPDLNKLGEDSDVPMQGGAGIFLDDIEADKDIETAKVVSDDTCFCSPIIQFFETLFGTSKSTNAFVLESNSIGLNEEEMPATIPAPKLAISSRHTQPLPINSSAAPSPSYLDHHSSTLNYSMPLKAPAWSIPVPISPQITRPLVQRTGSASQLPSSNSSSRNLSRSYSNGSKLNIAAMGVKSGTDSNTPKKEKIIYPPPPADYIDPKDGHIWRAKYCVLEDGILYFYRNAEEGESDDAQEERNESKFQSLDAMEGTGFDYESSNSPNRSSLVGRSSNGALFASVKHSGRALLRESRESRQDLQDLSKSPMPYKKSDIFEYASKRSTSNLSEASSAAPLHHSHSTNTFNFDSDILWEKRVALDCVGAVRSSEQDHGDHAFELLAFGMVGRTDEMSDSFSGKSQNEIVDRLILRAGGSDEMNNWMFQFHRSLASYMQRMVQQHTSHRPNSSLMHRRLPTPIHGGKGVLSPFGGKQSSSPTTNSFGGSLTASNIPGSLSHGHGRNALYRRQVRDNKDDALLISPVSTPGGGSSPIDATKPIVPALQSTTLAKIYNGAPDSLDHMEAIDAAPKKYIPPHLRNQDGPKKYIPPHLRKKAASIDNDKSDVPIQPKPQQYEEPLMDGEQDASDQNDSYSDSATNSLLSQQMDEESVSIVVNIRLGGCADPTVVVGSILDHHYISRKASVVGNARLEAYGGRGGGFFENNLICESRKRLKWEVGAASECGVRNSNEDAFVAINNLDELIRSQGLVSFADQDFGETKQQGLYAIFDGHVGNQAARYGAEKFVSTSFLTVYTRNSFLLLSYCCYHSSLIY